MTLQAQHRYRGKSLHIEEVHAGEYSQTEEPIFSSEYTHLQKEVSGSCCRPNTLWSSLPQSCEPTLRTAESYHSSPPPKPADVYYFRDHLLSFQANDWRFILCSAQHATHAAGTKSCTKAPAGQRIKCRWPGPGCDSTLLNSHRSQKPEFRRQESVAQKFMMDFVNDFRDSDAGDTRKGVLMTSKSLSYNSVF